jgi:hypothetical protein
MMSQEKKNFCISFVTIVQWIEHGSSKPRMKVRFLLVAPPSKGNKMDKINWKSLIAGCVIGTVVSTTFITASFAQGRPQQGAWPQQNRNTALVPAQRGWHGNPGWNNGWRGGVVVGGGGWGGSVVWNNGWNNGGCWGCWAPPIVYQQSMPVTIFQPNVITVQPQNSTTAARLAMIDRMMLDGTISYNEAQTLRAQVLATQ